MGFLLRELIYRGKADNAEFYYTLKVYLTYLPIRPLCVT